MTKHDDLNKALLRADLWRVLALAFSPPTGKSLGDLEALCVELASALGEEERSLREGLGELARNIKSLDFHDLEHEHNALFSALRAGARIDDSDYMCKSTMMAIMARMSAYTGKSISWDMAWNSKEDLSPEAFEWGPAPMRPVAQPGVTPFS